MMGCVSGSQVSFNFARQYYNSENPLSPAEWMQVEGLNDRMVDVDSNLNYMLGQLSLVVQEFNQVG